MIIDLPAGATPMQRFLTRMYDRRAQAVHNAASGKTADSREAALDLVNAIDCVIRDYIATHVQNAHRIP